MTEFEQNLFQLALENKHWLNIHLRESGSGGSSYALLTPVAGRDLPNKPAFTFPLEAWMNEQPRSFHVSRHGKRAKTPFAQRWKRYVAEADLPFNP